MTGTTDFAPRGGKFNGGRKEMLGKIIEDYKDTFVFSTCYIVADSLEEVAAALSAAPGLNSSGFQPNNQAVDKVK